jgi:hypothetical protein
MDDEEVCHACDRIDAATKDNDNETVYAALIALLTYRMSTEGCDHARETIVQHFKESLPEILANANRAAAQDARTREGKHMLTHTQH